MARGFSTTGQVPYGPARAHRMGAVTFNPKLRSPTAVNVGTTAGTNIIDGTLYLSKSEDRYPYNTISGIGRYFSAGFGAGSNGATAPSLLALPVYYWTPGATALTQVGVIDLVAVNSYGIGAAVHACSWTLPDFGLDLVFGLVVNLPYVSGSTGAVRVPVGQDSPNDWLTTGSDLLNFSIGATGITSLANIPTSINLSALSTTGLPSGPFQFGARQ